MTVDFVEMLRHKSHEVRNYIQSMDLELELLRRGPSLDDRVVLDGLRIKVQEERSQKVLLHHEVVSFKVFGVVAY